MNQHITPTGLKAEGWTDSLIRQHLGEPDATAPNPHYRTAGAPMRLYLRSRVASVAEHPEVKAQLAKTAAKRTQRRESAKRAVQTKVKQAQQHMRSQIADSLKQIVNQYTAKQLIAEACESYNQGDGVPEWVYNKRDWSKRASPRSDPGFLERICANFVRHQLLEYDRCLGGYTGTHQARDYAHQLVRNAVKKILKKL